MKQVVIENPVINSPFREPGRHFKFTDEGITNEIIDGRRTSSYFVPIAQPRKKGSKQLVFDTEWTQDRIEENKLVNQIRARVKLWREGGYVGVTPTTNRLLAYWIDPERETSIVVLTNFIHPTVRKDPRFRALRPALNDAALDAIGYRA